MSDDPRDFLNAIFGPYDGDVAFYLNESETTDAQAALESGDAYVIPLTPAGDVTFAYGVAEDVDPGEWMEFERRPTAVLFKPLDGTVKGTLIAAWAFECAFPVVEAQRLYDALGAEPSDPIPLPDVNGWRLLHVDDNTFYAKEELEAVYCPEPEDGEELPSEESEAPVLVSSDTLVIDFNEDLTCGESEAPVLVSKEEPVTFGDAIVMTPGWDPEKDPRLADLYPIALGPNHDSKQFQTKKNPLGQTLAMLCMHKEGAKDGPCFVGGEIIGTKRRAQAMKQLTFVGLDIDTGMKPDTIDKELLDLGCIAVRYSTHSNGRPYTEFLKSTVVKHLKAMGEDFEDISVNAMQRYMAEVGKYESYIVESVDEVEVDQTEEGFVVRVHHAPIPKNRIVLPMKEPFVLAKEHSDQAKAIAKWKKIPETLATRLGVPLDKTGVDPSRIFYLPRHKRNSPYEIRLFGGELFDWRSLDTDNPFLEVGEALESSGTKSKGKSKTEEGKALGRWSTQRAQGFQIVDLIRAEAEDRIRAEVTAGVEIECPFDESHSNAGDPDDKACMAVNAGDGVSEVFTITCRHESCADYTNLDMLGKMVKDGWFAADAIWEEEYNALADETSSGDASKPETPTKTDEDGKPVKLTLLDHIASLTRESTGEEIRKVIKEAAKLPTRFEYDAACRNIRSKTGMAVKAFTTEINKIWNPNKEKDVSDKPELRLDSNGRVTFRYYSVFNIDEALDVCKQVLENENKDVPTFTCTLDQPVGLRTDAATGRLEFIQLTDASMWAELCDRIFFQRRTDQGDCAREQVPKDVSKQLFNTAWKVLPQTPEIIYTPYFTKDGFLLKEPGWNKDLGVMMADTGFVIPEIFAEPNEEEVREALRTLREDVLGDFPFLDFNDNGEGKRQASEANALAMLITPFMRRMIDGCTPVFFVSKPTAGTGGTLLGKLPILLFDGEESFPMSYHKDNDEEQRKALLSAVMETRSHLFFDDVKDFNSRVLLQSVTARKIGGRILGQSSNAERDNTFNWIATGNNPDIREEMERRICWIRLNARTADIQKRTFRHADFPGFIAQERGRIVHAILTLVQNWVARGKPRYTERKLVSFEEWGALVGGVINEAWPEHGFLDNRRPPAANIDGAAIREFVNVWFKRFHHDEVKPKELLDMATGAALDIIEGNSDTHIKRIFMRKLESLEGQSFTIQGRNVMGRKKSSGIDEVVYLLELVEDTVQLTE